MDQPITKDILAEFEGLTQYPIISFIQQFTSFIQIDYPQIINYYSGNIDALNSNSFNNLADLLNEIQRLFETFNLHKDILMNYKWWVLISKIEEIDNSLILIDNASKWLRSTISRGNFNPNPEVDIPFNQGQTLESIERDVLGSADWDNTWSNLAIKNELREEDYTSQGGFLIKANFDYVLNNFRINSIVDNPIGEKVLGIDLDKKLQFIDNDLKILTPKLTFTQNITILINLRRGDNPEFFNQGLTPSLIVGTNINSVSFPVLFRQLSSLFKADDTIKSFSIISIDRQQDAVFINFNVQSRLGDVEKISLQA